MVFIVTIGLAWGMSYMHLVRREARSAATQPKIHSEILSSECYLLPNVSGADLEKSWGGEDEEDGENIVLQTLKMCIYGVSM